MKDKIRNEMQFETTRFAISTAVGVITGVLTFALLMGFFPPVGDYSGILVVCHAMVSTAVILISYLYMQWKLWKIQRKILRKHGL